MPWQRIRPGYPVPGELFTLLKESKLVSVGDEGGDRDSSVFEVKHASLCATVVCSRHAGVPDGTSFQAALILLERGHGTNSTGYGTHIKGHSAPERAKYVEAWMLAKSDATTVPRLQPMGRPCRPADLVERLAGWGLAGLILDQSDTNLKLGSSEVTVAVAFHEDPAMARVLPRGIAVPLQGSAAGETTSWVMGLLEGATRTSDVDE
ncbi:hypothetical protein ACX8Z9_09100 [Arthrobacter halodurans]|uniref:Uncharacterized protein n=1 Tax=Arthrobacter halodurans TaxID=516699 RepID=A0ABV4UN36_9MICC